MEKINPWLSETEGVINWLVMSYLILVLPLT